MADPTIAAAVTSLDALRQAIAEIRELHTPIEVGQPESRYWVCRECCYADDDDYLDDQRTDDCIDWHDHNDGQPTCPTNQILDRLDAP
jgi:hypothetical protein